jgi:hypothetical protein
LIEQLTLGVDVDKGKAAACERKPSGQVETLRQHKQESSEREQLVAAEWHKQQNGSSTQNQSKVIVAALSQSCC